jgi:hypothetical protein
MPNPYLGLWSGFAKNARMRAGNWKEIHNRTKPDY